MLEKYKFFYSIYIITFWIMMCWGFVSQEFLPFLQSLDSAVLLLGDAVLIMLGIVMMRNRGDFVFLTVYLLMAFISTILVNKVGMIHYLNGARDFIGLLFVVPIVRWFLMSDRKADFCRSMDRQLRVWLYVQAFCLTWQFVKYGANDAGGGSFGYGSSGMVSTLIYAVSFYFVIRRWDYDNIWQSIKQNKEYLILLYPTLLNETKISFAYLLIYIVLLVKVDRTLFIRSIFMVPIAAAVFALVFRIYVDVTNQSSEDILSEDFLEEYFFGSGADIAYHAELAQRYFDGDFDDALSVEWWAMDVPRMAKLVLLYPVIRDEPGGYWTGVGVGHMKGTRTIKPTKFYKEYEWTLFGTRMLLLFIVMELGIPGLIWWLWGFFRITGLRRKGLPHFDKRIALFITAQMVMAMFYTDYMRMAAPWMIFAYMLLQPRYTEPEAVEEEKLTLSYSLP